MSGKRIIVRGWAQQWQRLKTFKVGCLLFISFLATIFTPDKALDLYRYYEAANEINLDWSITELFQNFMDASFDFIYYLVFYIFRLLGLPLHLVNGMFVTLFYQGAYLLLFDYVKRDRTIKTINVQKAMLCMIFALPLTFVFSIARMTASFAFLFLALHNLLNQKWIKAVIFMVATFFTHSGSAMFMLFIGIAMILGYFVSKSSFLKKHNLLVFLSLAVLFYAVMELGMDLILRLPFFATYHYFAVYLEEAHNATFDGLGGIATITMFFYFFCLFINVWKANMTFPYNPVVFLPIFIIISYFMSDMFVQRTSMLCIPVLGILMVSASKKIENIQTILTLLAIFFGVSCLVSTHRFYI